MDSHGVRVPQVLFVEHADDLPDQHAHAKVGLYGHPDGPVAMLWSFGCTNAVQMDTGFISVQNSLSPNLDAFCSASSACPDCSPALGGNAGKGNLRKPAGARTGT